VQVDTRRNAVQSAGCPLAREKAASNFAKFLKALRWRTLFQAMSDTWQAHPSASKSTRTISSRDYTPNLLMYKYCMVRGHILLGEKNTNTAV